MNRRTALKAMAAVLMAPKIHLRETIDRERLLAAFVQRDNWVRRYDLGEPFGVGSLTYAAGPHRACRAELANRVEVGERRLPDMESVWRSWWCPERWEALDFPGPDSSRLFSHPGRNGGRCPMCSGRRISLGDHYPTDASDLTWQIENNYDVDDNTIGDASCRMCGGKPYGGNWILNVCGVAFDYSLLKPVAALPNVRVARSYPTAPHPSLCFQADGFEGIVLGMT